MIEKYQISIETVRWFLNQTSPKDLKSFPKDVMKDLQEIADRLYFLLQDDLEEGRNKKVYK